MKHTTAKMRKEIKFGQPGFQNDHVFPLNFQYGQSNKREYTFHNGVFTSESAY